MEKYEALNQYIDCGPLDLNHNANMYKEFFIRKDYEWWGNVKPGDVVVDIGACVGFFSCLALDKGASKVYMMEPNKDLLKVGIKNTIEYVINKPTSPVVPVHAAITGHEGHLQHVYQEQFAGDFTRYTFKDFIQSFKINKIDYLKLDCEGGEYNVLNKENLEYIVRNVRHIAVEVHLGHHEQGSQEFIQFRDEFLKHFIDQDRVRYMDNGIAERIWDTEAIIRGDGLPREFMIYILNG